LSDLVTVILTTYNNPFALYHSLNSVVKQTYKNLEIMVVDGGDMLMTKKIVDGFTDKRIVYVKVGDGDSDNRICGNVQYCRNIGVTLAQGKFVAMLDDDDRWAWNKIAKQVTWIGISKVSLIACNTVKMSGVKKTIDRPPRNPRFEDLLQTFNFSQTSAYLINKKDLVKAGGFNEELRSMHEYDVALRMAKCGYKIDVVPLPLLLSYCDNVKERKYYFTKMAETLDFWRCYGKDMHRLTIAQMIQNVTKTVALVTLYAVGYVVKEKVWGIIFKLKERYQKC